MPSYTRRASLKTPHASPVPPADKRVIGLRIGELGDKPAPVARWRAAIAAREPVFVARHEKHGVVGMTSFGRTRDSDLGLEGEVYTLYVDPAFYGEGVGRALLAQMRLTGESRTYRTTVSDQHCHDRHGSRLVHMQDDSG